MKYLSDEQAKHACRQQADSVALLKWEFEPK